MNHSVIAYAAFKGVSLAHFVEGDPKWEDWPAFKAAWSARLHVGNTKTDVIDDLRAVLHWEAERIGAISAGVLNGVIKRLEMGEAE